MKLSETNIVATPATSVTLRRRQCSPAVTFGDVEYPPAGALGPRVQQDLQLVLLLAGQVTIRLAAGSFTLWPQQAMLMLPGQTEHYSFAAHSNSRHSWCAIGQLLLTPSLWQALAPWLPLLTRPFLLSDPIARLIDDGLALPLAHLPAAHPLLDQLALLLLQRLIFEAATGQLAGQPAAPSAALPAAPVTQAQLPTVRQGLPNKAVAKACALMASRLSERLTLVALAEAVHLTPQHLTRLFRQHLGTTPVRYLWQLRTERGAALLRETGLAVGLIAEQTGFGSAFHFSRLVRQRYGLPPREVRRLAWSASAKSS
jgi:AraC-like DNA-binding protein